MSKLFLITLRWLKRDKRRTALAFSSIVLSVYLISFVGVYLSTALSSIKANVMYEDPSHAQITLDDLSQAETLDKNAAWESHLASSTGYFMMDGFFSRYVTSKESIFPEITINDVSVFDTDSNSGLKAAIMSGDAEELLGSSYFNLTGEMPKKEGEVAVSTATAVRYGNVGIGDEITIRCEARKGTLYYSHTDENGKTVLDENGDVVFDEDKYGFKLKQIYAGISAVQADPYETLSYMYRFGKTGELPKNTLTINDFELPYCKVKLSDESVDTFEYTAKITGLIDGGAYGNYADIAFSPEDKSILPFFSNSAVQYNVRVKKGLDAEESCIKALQAMGLDDENHSRLSMNIMLLMLEGRQLEYFGQIGYLFAVGAVVLGLFVFLARLIINNAFEISAAYRTEQYGALKTVGASDKQIFIMIMFECLLYMLTALPLGFGLAVAVGKLLLARVREIGVFDPLYGEGVSNSFFKLELSPFVMAVSFGCAMFSIFFSSYADAMRVKRMPPIQSVGYGKKTRGGRHSKWRSRRILGYPRAFTLKCISKQKVRFTVTLLAAIISGIFIMTFVGITNISGKDKEELIPCSPDIMINTMPTDLETHRGQFEKLKASGLFEDVKPGASVYISPDRRKAAKDYNSAHYSDGLKKLYKDYLSDLYGGDMYVPALDIFLIDRDNYDKYIISDMTYDEFAASGKPLISDTVMWDYYDEASLKRLQKDFGVKECYEGTYEQRICRLDINTFNNDDISTLSFDIEKRGTDENGKPTSETCECRLEFGGRYTTTDPAYGFGYNSLTAIMPYDDFSLEKLGEENTELLKDRFYFGGFTLKVKEGCADRARSVIKSEFGGEEDSIEDFLSTKEYNERKVKALRIAGMGFALSLAAVVLLNIYSTMRANMINRRRDFAMMRSCGMSLKQIRKSLFFEARLYALITTLISSVAGWVVALCVCGLTEATEENAYSAIPRLMFHFPWQGSLLVFAVIMLTMTAAFLPALYSMKKQDIAQEIRTDI